MKKIVRKILIFTLMACIVFTFAGCQIFNDLAGLNPKVQLNKTSLSLEIGDSEKLVATKTDAELDELIWSSSNTSVAIVSQDGTVEALTEGSATITVKLSINTSCTATCSITVTAKGEVGCIGTTNIPHYSGNLFIQLNENVPVFSEEEKSTVGYENYSDLDNLGRCGVAVASLGLDTMPAPDEDRGSISNVYPSGWKYNGKSNNNKYDTSLVSGGYIYNRSHMIGWQLSAENANNKNLITGTRYFNTPGMLDFENMVADYIKETENHVAYRVTPVYEGDNLVCHGVQIEAYSVEDNGEGICFNVFIYNVQPGIIINYATGENWLDPDQIQSASNEDLIIGFTQIIDIFDQKKSTNFVDFYIFCHSEER